MSHVVYTDGDQEFQVFTNEVEFGVHMYPWESYCFALFDLYFIFDEVNN